MKEVNVPLGPDDDFSKTGLRPVLKSCSVPVAGLQFPPFDATIATEILGGTDGVNVLAIKLFLAEKLPTPCGPIKQEQQATNVPGNAFPGNGLLSKTYTLAQTSPPEAPVFVTSRYTSPEKRFFA